MIYLVKRKVGILLKIISEVFAIIVHISKEEEIDNRW